MLSTVILIASLAVAAQAAPKHFAPRFPVNGRIVGGVVANIEDLPYQVSLQRSSGHFCGGSIISDKWILSAAHCLENFPADRLAIRVGSSFHKTEGKVLKVANIYSHPEYDNKAYDYDYALIELVEELEYSDAVQNVTLPDQDETIEVGSKCLVSGWGNTKQATESKDKLRVVEVPVVDREHCQKQYAEFNEITDRMVCAGFEQGGKDSCQGDSGGPLVHENVLVGVVSWGKGCADKHFSGVYANVAAVRDWIKEVSAV